MRRLLATFVIGCVGIAGTISNAEASAFAVREDSAEGLGTIFAGAGSRADDASTVFDNPAGMTKLNSNVLEFGGVLVFPTIDFHGSLASPAGAALPGNNGNNGGRPGLAPNFYAVYGITNDLKVGIAVNAPFGLTVKNNAGWYGRYLATDGAILTTNINPSVAYKINDKISVGGGVSAQWMDGAFTQLVYQAAAIPGAPDGTVRFHGQSWGFGYNVGILLEPWNGTKIGLTYRSKIEQKLKGGLDFTNINPALAAAGGLITGPSAIGLRLPATSGLSVTHVVTPQLNVSLDIQYTQWSVFKELTFSNPNFSSPNNFNFSNTWFTSLGATYQLNDVWTLRGGIGWDQSPVPNQYRDVSIPDQDRYMIGVGFGYKISDPFLLDFAYAHYFATPASMNGSVNKIVPGTLGSTLSGTYQESLDYLAASLTYKF